MHLLAFVSLLLGTGDGIDLIKWLGSKEAFLKARAKNTERWVLIYKEWPKKGPCQRFEAGTLLDERIRALVELNFHPVLTRDPSSPRTVGGKEVQIELEIWKETEAWGPDEILWLVSPDKKTRVPIPYVNSERQRPTTPAELTAKIREALKEHDVRLVEPKQGEEKPKPRRGRADQYIDRLYEFGRRAGIRIVKIGADKPPRRTGRRPAPRAEGADPVIYVALSVSGGLYALGKFAFLLESSDPPVIVRRWRTQAHAVRENGRRWKANFSLSFNAPKEHDLHYWKAFDRIWAILDGQEGVWVTDLEFVDPTRARELLRKVRKAPKARRDATPAFAVHVKLGMHGNDAGRPAEIRKALCDDEYLGKHFPITNSDLKVIRLEKEGREISLFQVIMIAKPPKK